MERISQPGFVVAWSQAWSNRPFRWTLLGTSAAAVLSLVIMPSMLRTVERRPGRIPPDPLLPHLGPAPVGAIIFGVLLSTLVLVVGSCLDRPMVLIRGACACVLLFAFRLITMLLVPLAAPPGEIALRDPIGQLFYPGGAPETRDLFFSGHTATLVLLIALVRSRRAKIAVAAAAATVGMLLLVQHAHWTVDVLTAPVFAALAWRLSAFALPTRGEPDAPRLRRNRRGKARLTPVVSVWLGADDGWTDPAQHCEHHEADRHDEPGGQQPVDQHRGGGRALGRVGGDQAGEQ